ncbi:nickel-dependent lactate racemase [Halarsenatibacter silvermanii]|uniref:Nickel-dependent lactate racemase n=1 Tax=Halarsenatibacter silvermanii TaxID=321763 RepID=A0A1G9JX25_9FIRM|nr:nickel-dependent lactate racemase [Halarsenatibacter silvermanii]SDL41942.1 Nickel-dependent lactate racemase [Halarsenatibacter silvermanii]
MKFDIPYGKENISFTIENDRIEGVLESRANEYEPEADQKALVDSALTDPINSPDLKEIARDKKEVVIICSDHTRPVPSRFIIPPMLAKIREGNPEASIKLLIATGFHRPSTEEELVDKFGQKIVENEEIIVHRSENKDEIVHLGSLPSGGDLELNKHAVEADLLLAEGFIEPHFFAGFSGGRKSVLPGVASRETVLGNHCGEFIAHENARTGILEGNPLHKDMLYAAEKAELEFIVNVAINQDKEIINAFAGDYKKAHEKGCEFVARLAGVKAAPADIVITTNGGYPLDQNIYQSVKGMTAAEAACKENGVIIIAAECSDGHGGEGFYNTFLEADSVQQIREDIKSRDMSETVPDQWESQILARILDKFEVIMITGAPRKMVEDMYMYKAENMDEALSMAEDMVAEVKPGITVIPDGVSVIVEK